MEIKQERYSDRTGFAFGEEEPKYCNQDSSGNRTFSVPYMDISRDRQTLEERNHWLRNAGLIWIALGAVFTVATCFSEQEFVPSMWLLIGGGCYAVYRLRSTRVVAEIEKRRAVREQYDYINADKAPEQKCNRYKWLHKADALTDDELQQRLMGMPATSRQL